MSNTWKRANVLLSHLFSWGNDRTSEYKDGNDASLVMLERNVKYRKVSEGEYVDSKGDVANEFFIANEDGTFQRVFPKGPASTKY
jgi:hypothetical protein